MLRAVPTVPDGADVTDARFPDRWLLDRRIMTLPPAAFRAYALSLMWAVSNRTDGLIYPVELKLVPDGVSDEHRDLFVSKDLWGVQGDAWLILDFDKTQTSAAQLEAYEDQAQREKQRKREKRAAAVKSKTTGVAAAERRADGGPPTKDRTGKASTGREVEVASDQRFSGSDADQMVTPPLDRLSVVCPESEADWWKREWGSEAS